MEKSLKKPAMIVAIEGGYEHNGASWTRLCDANPRA